MGCGQFQIVPELEPDTRCDCVRCGITIRRSRSNPLSRGLALNCAGLVLFIIVWTAMLMKVSTAGIDDLYERLPSKDFSREVLQRIAGRLDLVVVPPCGWSDLGTPSRLERFRRAAPERRAALSA